ncbi:acyltransferase family protein [Paracoccus limosus]|uniref:acyltransferase family protein n=1 Tax=Paracoccus limosus TaxID=913252 RepID=UPI0014789E6D|nr:acyltransferase [Paracoccus limosus]
MLGNIQILRFVAASMVVLFHVALTASNEGISPGLIQGFGIWGESGVDIFFVISGLVMMLSQSRKHRTAAAFLTERAIRILPMYWALTLLLAGVLLVMPQLFNSDSFTLRKTLASLFMVNWLAGDGMPVLYLGWTLEYEWIFYVAFSLGFAVLPLRLAWIPVLAILLLLNVAGFIGLFAIEFVYGMLIGLLFLRGNWRLPLPWLFVLLGFAAMAAHAYLPLQAVPRHIGYGIPAAMIVAGLIGLPQARGRLALLAGAASYSIYLVQVFAIPVAFRIVKKLPALPDGVAALLVVAASLLAGVLAYLLVEKPLTGLALRIWGPRHDSGPVLTGAPPQR